MEKKILEIISWQEKPNWSERLTKYALSLSPAKLAAHIEAINAEIDKNENAHNMLFVASGCFVTVLKDKLKL